MVRVLVRLALAQTLWLLAVTAHAGPAGQDFSGCVKHTIQKVMYTAQLVQLDDGAYWHVEGASQSLTMFLVPDDRVIICSDTLVDLEDNHTLMVSPVR